MVFSEKKACDYFCSFGVILGKEPMLVADFYKTPRNESGNTHCTVQKAIGHFPKFKPARKEYRQNGRRHSHEPVGRQFLANHLPRYHNPEI